MEMRPALLPIDAGSVTARRIYGALLAKQTAQQGRDEEQVDWPCIVG